MPQVHDIEKQKRQMRTHWKCWRITEENEKLIRWEGEVTPISKTYKLQIELRKKQKRGFRGLIEPTVRVLDPEIQERSVPHLYADGTLCLATDKNTRRTKNALVASHTIPWAIEWLDCYECWQVTHEWKCGGKHPPRQG